MSKKSTLGTWYVVTYATVVDHPEHRDASYPVVRPGHVIAGRSVCDTQRNAVGLFDAMVAGEWDFESEFVRAVSVLRVSIDAYGLERSVVVRKRVERERRDGVVVRAA